jgi:sigma-E factor negative regulatory protein RseC
MIEQRAKVLKVEGNNIWVDTSPQSACGSCNQRKQCSANTFENTFISERKPLQLPNTLSAQTGDWIVLGVNENALFQSVALIYLLPVVLMVTSAVIGNTLGFNDVGVIFTALIGLGIGGLISYIFLAPRLSVLTPTPLRLSNQL